MNNISSIDPEELKKFNKTNQEWWDLDGEFKMLHQITPVRTQYIKTKILEHFNIDNSQEKPLSNLDLLDIGSGGGLVCKPMHDLGAKVTGLDANSYNTKAASSFASEHNLDISYINDTVENYAPSHKQKFDIVLCLEVLEHVANPKSFLENISNLVKDNGILIFSTINRTTKSYGQAIIMAEYVLGWVPKKTHQHSKFVKPSELAFMLSETPWQLTELKGLTLSLSENNWHLTEDVDVNYFALFKNLL